MRILSSQELESPSLIDEDPYDPDYLKYLFLEQMFTHRYLEEKTRTKGMQSVMIDLYCKFNKDKLLEFLIGHSEYNENEAIITC